jgi:heme exporter protein A
LNTQINQLEASDLTCERGEETIFDGLDVRARSTEVLQLKGRNGSGKTSLLRILCGLARPAAGSIRWNGVDIRTDPEAFRRHIGYIGHRRAVCEDLTPLENVQFANALETPRPAAACREALARVELSHVAEIPARLLSAGQNQRTALARLLVSDAACWFLDEPFTALDLDGRKIIETIIAEHAAAGGMSVVATHQPMTLRGVEAKTLLLDPV